MLSVLRRPAWVGLGLVVVGLSALFVLLGQWQLGRLDERQARNAVIEAQLEAAPAPAATVLTVGEPLQPENRFRLIRASGQYDAAGQVLVRNPMGRSGYEVVTPLVTESGAVLWVDRGWIPRSGEDAAAVPAAPPPPDGSVEVVVRMRESQPPRAGDAPPGQVFAIDTAELAGRLDSPAYGGYGELVSQTPPPGDRPELPAPPSVSEGPHLYYALQWFSFVVIAVGGFLLLAWRESRTPAGTPPARSSPPSRAG